VVAADETGLPDQVRRRIGSGPNRRCDTVCDPDFFESYTK
jgi:hypothetical protein